MNFEKFEEKAGVIFKDKSLLKQAFTHRSYINENRGSALEHNERMEFLGDAVLELVITDFLYKKLKDSNEGELTSLRSALANALEALIGAIYLDQGYDVAQNFILTHIAPLVDDILKGGAWIDSKSLFQEKVQEHVGLTPSYETMRESGPDHDKHFVVGVYVGKEKYGEGEGKSKQDAEQEAARTALVAKGWK